MVMPKKYFTEEERKRAHSRYSLKSQAKAARSDNVLKMVGLVQCLADIVELDFNNAKILTLAENLVDRGWRAKKKDIF